MAPQLVAVICSPRFAALLVEHPAYSVIFAAPTGTDRQAVDTAPPVAEGEEVTPAPLLLDYDQAAAALRLSERMVRTLISTGQLPAVSVGRARRVRATDLAAYVAALGSATTTTDRTS